MTFGSLLPSLLLAFTLSTIFGAGFHVVEGGGARRLALYLLAGWVGFAVGQLAGDALGITFLKIGVVNALIASLGSLLALFTARWLATSEVIDSQK